MKVLSLFDGISCCRLALERLGVNIEKYYASEVDKYAIAITRYNFSDTIFVGDIRNLNGKDFKDIDLMTGGSPCQSFSFSGKRQGIVTKENVEITTLEQYLELKEQRFEFKGQSYLFWEFVRLLKEIKPKYFLLENVKMAKKWKNVITNALGVEPVEINSALVSAQNRRRLYWVGKLNEQGEYETVYIPQPKDKGLLLKDIIEDEVENKYYINKRIINIKGDTSKKKLIENIRTIYEKSKCLTAGGQNVTNSGATNLCIQVGELDIKGQECIKRIYSIEGKSPTLTTMQGGYRQPKIVVDKDKSYCIDACYYKGGNLRQYFEKHRRQLIFKIEKNEIMARKLTPLECERLQTLPDNYTQYGLFDDGRIKKISDTQRYKTIGNGWTVDVIVHIFKYLFKNDKRSSETL